MGAGSEKGKGPDGFGGSASVRQQVFIQYVAALIPSGQCFESGQELMDGAQQIFDATIEHFRDRPDLYN